MYCDEQGCDCRRVIYSVVFSKTKKIEAVISYGWESPSFYSKWMRSSDPHVISAIKGACLNIGSYQSKLAPAILELFKKTLVNDSKYMDRVKRHYELFRDAVERQRDSAHPRNN
mgnify:FL=1